eukprot:1195776-Prorocentrum_minimum.AAC.2
MAGEFEGDASPFKSRPCTGRYAADPGLFAFNLRIPLSSLSRDCLSNDNGIRSLTATPPQRRRSRGSVRRWYPSRPPLDPLSTPSRTVRGRQLAEIRPPRRRLQGVRARGSTSERARRGTSTWRRGGGTWSRARTRTRCCRRRSWRAGSSGGSTRRGWASRGGGRRRRRYRRKRSCRTSTPNGTGGTRACPTSSRQWCAPTGSPYHRITVSLYHCITELQNFYSEWDGRGTRACPTSGRQWCMPTDSLYHGVAALLLRVRRARYAVSDFEP